MQNTNFGAYIFFAVFCVLSGIWTFFCVPETNGRTLEQMDHVFKDVRGEEEMARRARIEQAIFTESLPGGETVAVEPPGKALDV